MQKLSSQILWQGNWTFRIDHVLLDNGREMNLAVLDHPGAVVLVPILDENVLMISQYRPVLDQTILELPAGTIEADEDFLAGAQRELREETGYRAEKLTLLSKIAPSPGTSNEIMHILLATGLSVDPLPMDENEVIELAPMPLTELVDMAQSGKLIDGKSVVGILQAAHFLATL